jgi:acetyl-CoA carboxylase carboxyl transferase subunit alpha
MTFVLPFEKRVAEIVTRVRELRALSHKDESLASEVEVLEENAAQLAREVFRTLTPHQKVQLARHPNRPYLMDYVSRLFEDFVELHGDRRFADDPALIGGVARFRGRSVMVVGHQKGRTTKENVLRRFGSPNPDGYRKAIRLYELADRFRIPILTFVDTQGAFPGIEAEERGQAEAIAASLEVMSRMGVPIVTTITGEGGSGGALALAVANITLALEHSFYSVISPEGCASILWRSAEKASEAAAALKLTAPHLLEFGVVDRIVDEPTGGAHRDHDGAAQRVGDAVFEALTSLDQLSPDELREHRYQRYRKLGAFLS